MEMRHINENTIHVLISHEDLEERGVSFLDLLGSHKEIENFFCSASEEIDIEEEFRGNEAITFQILPKGGGSELFISRNLPDKEISQSGDFTVDSEDVSDFLRQQTIGSDPEEELSRNTSEEQERQAAFALGDSEQTIQLATDAELESARTDLYLFEECYYLIVHFQMENLSQVSIESQITRVLEFAGKSDRTPETLDEYGQCLVTRNAIERTKFYFV